MGQVREKMPFNLTKYVNIARNATDSYDPHMLTYGRNDDETPLNITQKELKKTEELSRRALHAKGTILHVDRMVSVDNKLINRKQTIVDGQLFRTKKRVVIDESKNTVRYIDRIVRNNTDLRNLRTSDGYYL